MPETALLVVDAQKGFGSNGELAVPAAEEIVPVINKLMDSFALVVASQDWHPADHVSFAQSHPGKNPGDVVQLGSLTQPLFGVHCVAGTRGSEFLDGLETGKFTKVFRKGTQSNVDSFSAFIDNQGGKATDLDEYLKQQGVKKLYVTGLATNYCVELSAIDAINLGFDVYLIEDACRGIDGTTGEVTKSIARMKNAGIKVVHSNEL